LERDFNLPPLAELLREISQVRELQQGCDDTLVGAVG